MDLKIGMRKFLVIAILAVAAPHAAVAKEEKPASLEAIIEELSALRSLVESQQRQIEELRAAAQPSASSTSSSSATAETLAPVRAAALVQAAPVAQEDLVKRVDTLAANLGGFKFSGDFRLRLDAQLRSGNTIVGPLQNIRSRYRVRFNADKDIDPKFKFHIQLSTGPINNQTTNDQEFGAMAVKQPFFVSEAYIDYHPNTRVSLRGGRMEEVWADQTRFLWDDDVRFDGFQQIATIPLKSKTFDKLEFRSGEYFLSNPNVPILASTSPPSPFVSAGYTPGQKVRDANLFNPGVMLSGAFGKQWTHQAIADIALYRNQNQIALSSTAAGFPAVINNSIGLSLSGPITAVGNATTTQGGAIYNAGRYQIARIAYRITDKGLKMGNREMPLYFDVQAARNIGTHQFNDAFMFTANLGDVKKFGDVRFLYQYAIKDANAIISQFTDDDLGTGSTVNFAAHGIRFDLGLTRFLQWQNLVFIQNAREGNNPAQQFFVPVPRGANTTYRYLGQLAFTF
jgi:putative porin